MEIDGISLHLRRHTAIILKHWNGNKKEPIQIRAGTYLGDVIWSQLEQQRLPLPKEDYPELDATVEIEMAQGYYRDFDLRYAAAFIPYKKMKRIDRWIHEYFIHEGWLYYQSSDDVNRRQAVDKMMASYQLTDADVNSDSIYMRLRRMEKEFKRTGRIQNNNLL